MNINDPFTQHLFGSGSPQFPPSSCPCPQCVPMSFGYVPPTASRNAPPSPYGAYPASSYQPADLSMQSEAYLREQFARETAERQRLFDLEEARLREEYELHQREADAQLRAEEEEADREQAELEAYLAKAELEEKAEKKEVRREKRKKFLKNVWNELNGTNETRRVNAYNEYVMREYAQVQELKRTGGYLPDGRYVVPENKYHTAYALKPGEKPPLNLRADVMQRRIGTMFGMKMG